VDKAPAARYISSTTLQVEFTMSTHAVEHAAEETRIALGNAPIQLPCGFASLRCLIGNTPLLAVHLLVGGEKRTIYAKAEHLNLTGSIKDRMALHILECAYSTGQLLPGDCIAEATSGNTGIAFSALGRALGHKVVIYMPDWMSKERIALIQSLGASIELVSHAEGGFLGSIAFTEALAANACQKTGRVFLPKQFSNTANSDAHALTTGPELLAQLRAIGKLPDAFVAGVGTGGTVMGVGEALRAHNPKVKLHPVEPAESPTLSTGYKVGKHRIQGVSDEFIPDIVKLKSLDAIIAINDGDAILMAQKLAQTLGLPVGISSGANLLAALQVQDGLGKDAVVTTVFCDDNKKYLSTDLLRVEPVREHYRSPSIELIGFECLPRLAHPPSLMS
jgi:cysteine synthase